MTVPSLWCLQLSVVLPDGSRPEDHPSLARLEDAVRSMVAVTNRVRVDTFVTQPEAVRSYLVATLGFHVLQADGSCFCGWEPGEGGESHAEHVAGVFEDSTRSHATM